MSRRSQMDRIEHLLHRLDAAVVVREPGNARAAEQFEGLRRQVGLAAKNHRVHVAHLLSLADSLQRGASVDLVRDRVNDFLSELGVKYVQEVLDNSLFEVVETIDGDGDRLEVIEPAVIELLEGGAASPLRLGKARRVRAAGTPNPEEPTTAADETVVPPTPLASSEFKRALPLIAVGVASLLLGILAGVTLFDGSDTQPVDEPAITEQND